MPKVTMLPQRDRVVRVTLQDGRRLEGELRVVNSCYEVGGVVFDPWQIEEFEDLA